MFWNSGKLPDSSVLSELGEHLMDSSHQIVLFKGLCEVCCVDSYKPFLVLEVVANFLKTTLASAFVWNHFGSWTSTPVCLLLSKSW